MSKDNQKDLTVLEIALQRAYDSKDVRGFCKLLSRIMTLNGKSFDCGDGSEVFQYALASIQKKKDDIYDKAWEDAITKGDKK